MRATTAWPRASPRPEAMTCAPSPPNATAISRPMLLVEPVTRAVLFSSRRVMVAMLETYFWTRKSNSLSASHTQRGCSPPPRNVFAWLSRRLSGLPGDDGHGGTTAVDVQHDAVDEAGLVAGKVDRGVRDLLRPAHPAGRGAVHIRLGRVHLPGHLLEHHARRDGVDADPLRPELGGPGPRQGLHRALGGAVQRAAAGAQAGDPRAQVDDRPAAR